MTYLLIVISMYGPMSINEMESQEVCYKVARDIKEMDQLAFQVQCIPLYQSPVQSNEPD